MVNAFLEKLHLQCRCAKRGNLPNFLSIEEVIDEDKSLILNVREKTMNHFGNTIQAV